MVKLKHPFSFILQEPVPRVQCIIVSWMVLPKLLVHALETHVQVNVFEMVGLADTINNINLYALVNESTKEPGFAKQKQSGHAVQTPNQETVRPKQRTT